MSETIQPVLHENKILCVPLTFPVPKRKSRIEIHMTFCTYVRTTPQEDNAGTRHARAARYLATGDPVRVASDSPTAFQCAPGARWLFGDLRETQPPAFQCNIYLAQGRGI